MGITQSKELLGFILDLFKAVQDSIADDGRVTFTDVGRFVNVAFGAPIAFGGIQDIPGEWADLDDDEKYELVDFCARKFDLRNDGLEELVERTFATVLNLADLGRDWGALRTQQNNEEQA